MTKYRCLWHKSTTNHYILYFVHVLGLNSPNKGHCLWKARTSIAGRGFGRASLLKIRCRGPVSTPPWTPAGATNPSLVITGSWRQAAKRLTAVKVGGCGVG